MSKHSEDQKRRRVEEKQSAEAKALLEGVFATGERSEAGVYTQHKGNLLVLGGSYEDICQEVAVLKRDEPHALIEFQTFYWTGKDMSKHKISIEAASILEVVEVTEEAWSQHVTQKIEEAQAAALQRGGLHMAS